MIHLVCTTTCHARRTRRRWHVALGHTIIAQGFRNEAAARYWARMTGWADLGWEQTASLGPSRRGKKA